MAYREILTSPRIYFYVSVTLHFVLDPVFVLFIFCYPLIPLSPLEYDHWQMIVFPTDSSGSTYFPTIINPKGIPQPIFPSEYH